MQSFLDYIVRVWRVEGMRGLLKRGIGENQRDREDKRTRDRKKVNKRIEKWRMKDMEAKIGERIREIERRN